MKKLTNKFIIGFLMMVLLAVTIAQPAAPAQAARAGQASIIAWNNSMLRTVIALGQIPAPASFVYAAYAQTAVYNALLPSKVDTSHMEVAYRPTRRLV